SHFQKHLKTSTKQVAFSPIRTTTKTPLTRSSDTPDALLQAISGIQEIFLNITSELKSIKTNLNAVQQVILTLKSDLDDVQSSITPFPMTLATLENKINNVTEESTTRI
ncbi:MAG: hypothetical protein ACK53Y_08995, partial [bacterium]